MGIIVSDDGRFAASPDGLFDDNAGVECKVPEPKTHVKYLLGGVVPDEYLPQVHGSIFAAGSAYWKFLSWRPEFPKLVLTVERDNRILDVIGEAVEEFNVRFDRAWARLVNLNGGELPPPPPTLEIDSEGTVTKTMAGKESAVVEWLRNGDPK